MSGFAQGLLAGFSTVDQAMTRRKELGLREAQLAQQQKNNCHERCNSDPHPTPEIRSR
ncbi:hypothetical protein HEL02_022870, partial [Escherichia coli]|nr:hypothetical protein [Escherichia coli]